MKIGITNLSNVNKLQKINYNAKTKQVSFCAGDEFVKTTVEKTFKDVKKEIQQKYQPTISALRKRESTKLLDLGKEINKSDLILKFVDFNDYIELELDSLSKEFNALDKTAQKNFPRKDEVVFYKWIKRFNRKIKEYFEYEIKYSAKGKEYKCKDTIRKLPGLMIESKDEELSNKFIDFLRFYYERGFNRSLYCRDEVKAREVLRNGAEKISDWVIVSDTSGDRDNLREKIADAAISAEKKFKQTGRKSIIQVENMESLLRNGENKEADLAVIKDWMSNTPEATFVFSTTDRSKCDVGTLATSRVSLKLNLDEKFDNPTALIEKLNKKSSRELLQPEIDKTRTLYEEYKQTQIEIEKLQNQCREEIEQAKKAMPKRPKIRQPKQIKPQIEAKKVVETVESSTVPTPSMLPATPPTPPAPQPTTQPTTPPSGGSDTPNKLKELINKAIKKVKENKKAVIIIGAVVAGLAATGIILHKKGKLKNQKATTNQAQQPLKVQNTATSNILKTETPKIFSDFQL